jgi:DEAD/DEAH box helicase domain-containing protein
LIYPTKALASDQLERIKALCSDFGLNIAKYDGDTSSKLRREILTEPHPNILITNPDMLHKNLMNENLKKLLVTVKFIVFDEIHNYSGVFGSSVHYIIKRLKRFVADVQFICSSATVGNPKKFIETLFEEPFEIVRAKKILKERRHHLMIMPNHSKYTEAVYLTKELTDKLNMKTLVFCDSHVSCELLKKIADFKNVNIALHRAGIQNSKRCEVEKNFKNGKFDAVVCTPTLELGIDIGDLGAVINLSIPPTFNRYLQRIGRAGRSEEESIDVLLIGDDPISNYYANHPKEYYSSKPDPVYIDIENPEVKKRQLISACVDAPLTPDDLIQLRDSEKKVMKELLDDGYIQLLDKFYLVPTDKGYKLFNATNLRGSGYSVIIECKDKMIGERETQLAIKELHDDAIYMSGGNDYRVIEFDAKNNKVRVEKLFKRQKYYTKALFTSNIHNFEPIEKENVHGLHIVHGMGDISELVDGYVVKDLLKNKILAKKDLDKPLTFSFNTKMIYFKIPFDPEFKLNNKIKASHTVEHVIIHAGITLTGADITELGGVSYPDGSIFIHDGTPGGSGLTKLLFDRFDKVVFRAREILKNCKCVEDGCPNCTYSPYCGSNNDYLSKSIALQVLNDILNETYHKKRITSKIEYTGNPIV